MAHTQVTSFSLVKKLGLALALTLSGALALAQAPAATPLAATPAEAAPAPAVVAANDSPAITPQEREAQLLFAGYQAIMKNDYVQAEDLLNQARQISPDDNFVLLNLAVVYQATGRKDAAIAMNQQVIASDKSSNQSSRVEGDPQKLKQLDGQSVADVATYNLALLQHTNGNALREGYQAMQDKNYAKAETLLNQARVEAPNNMFVLLNLGVVYQLTERKQQAAVLFKQIIASDAKPMSPSRVVTLARRNLALIDNAAL